jgi:hypothetical protein
MCRLQLKCVRSSIEITKDWVLDRHCPITTCEEASCERASRGASITPLRKFLSITLLALFGLPFCSPFFAISAKGESSLPACCRRNGKHHCMLTRASGEDAAGAGSMLQAPLEKCPYYPASPAAFHQSQFGIAPSQIIFAELLSHPAVHAQLESRQRISRSRSRQKRGPPASSFESSST